MTTDNIDEAYRQGKLHIAQHVLDMIAQGGTPTQIVARITSSLNGFKQTRENKAEAVAALKARLDAEVKG